MGMICRKCGGIITDFQEGELEICLECLIESIREQQLKLSEFIREYDEG
jgi:hypothetical protein